MNAWEKAISEAERASSSSIFVRLTGDGDSVVGAFVGEPHVKKNHWLGDRTVLCTEDGQCAECKAGNRPSTRMAINLYVVGENAMRVVEGGPEWFRTLVTVRDKYGLDKWTFEIRRHGAARDPQTRYTMLPEHEIDAGLRAKIASTPCHDLAALARGDSSKSAPSARSTPSTSAPANAVIDIDVAKSIADKLRQVPRADVEAFLKAFRIERIRQLRSADVADAQAYVDKLVRARAIEEVDPWS